MKDEGPSSFQSLILLLVIKVRSTVFNRDQHDTGIILNRYLAYPIQPREKKDPDSMDSFRSTRIMTVMRT